MVTKLVEPTTVRRCGLRTCEGTGRFRRATGLAALLVWLTVLTLVLPSREGHGTVLAATAKPNVLLIVADDMRDDGLLAMPTVQALAAHGVTFTNAVVTTPLCCPSRASILTGTYASHHGVRTNESPYGGASAFDARSTLATWLQQADVRTGLVGRYLNGYDSLLIPPGWDSWFVFQQNRKSVTLYADYFVNDHGGRRHYGNEAADYSTRVLGRQLRGFLSRQPERPFFALFAPRTPHGPADPDPQDLNQFQHVDLPTLPAYDEADISDKPAWVRENGQLRDGEHRRIDKLRRRQLEALAGLDREIAQTLDALRADGRLASTWIMFTSDNGVLMGEHRLDAGKACAFEPCVNVPFIVVPPGGLDEGRVEAQVVANIDLAPTIAEIMGAAVPADVDGLSLVPLIADPATPWRDGVLLEQWHEDPARRWTGVRTTTHKYVQYDNGDEALYDLVVDPHELDSKARNPAAAEQRAALRDQLERLLSR